MCVLCVCWRKKAESAIKQTISFLSYKDSSGVFVNMNRSFFVNVKTKKGRVLKVVRVGFWC